MDNVKKGARSDKTSNNITTSCAEMKPRRQRYIPFCEIGAKACAEARTARKANTCLNILNIILFIVVIVLIVADRATRVCKGRVL